MSTLSQGTMLFVLFGIVTALIAFACFSISAPRKKDRG